MNSILLKSVEMKLTDLDGSKNLFLSCCSTGRGQVNTEGVISIARAFLCASARAVLASLRQAKDEVHDMLLSASSTGEGESC